MTPTPTSPEAQRAAEQLHEYFEQVRSDPLRVPDSDITESIIQEALSAATEGANKELREGIAAIKEAADWMQELADEGDSAGWVIEKHGDLAARLRSLLLRLEDGK